MNKKAFCLEIVSAEKQIFSGLVNKIHITGSEGELEVFYNHSPLLTFIKPGMVDFIKENKNYKEYIYISGGIFEIQPKLVIILADVAIHGKDLDENKEIISKRKIEENIKNSTNNINQKNIFAELTKSLAKLRVIELTKKNYNKNNIL